MAPKAEVEVANQPRNKCKVGLRCTPDVFVLGCPNADDEGAEACPNGDDTVDADPKADCAGAAAFPKGEFVEAPPDPIKISILVQSA